MYESCLPCDILMRVEDLRHPDVTMLEGSCVSEGKDRRGQKGDEGECGEHSAEDKRILKERGELESTDDGLLLNQ